MAFEPRVYPEIIGEMISRLISTTPLTDINFGSVFTTMLEAAAQEDDEQYFQMLEIIRGYSLDTTTGSDLDDRAFEYGLTRNAAQFASTTVTLGDSSITKISTGVYSGLSGAVAGSVKINGDSAASFPVSGSIIVGRNTPNVETVLYSSITDNGNYVTFNLSSSLANDHGTDETIIYSQGGNRTIGIGVTVIVPASDLSPLISFSLSTAAIILDGESEITGIVAVATVAGSSANVPVGSISQFSSLPFSTATVTNPQRVTNGKDIETDQELRDRIKSHIQSLSRGTGKSIITGITGITSDSENKRVVSASLIEPTVPADVVKLFIDDGTGFIPSLAHVGYEEIVSSATGGEKYLKTTNFPLVKAFVETQSEEPFNIVLNDTIFVEVGGKVETITFALGDFVTSGQVKAQEVLKKINVSAAAFEARVSSGGSKVRIFSRSNTDEQIRVTGGTANAALAFPTDTKHTARLYLERSNALSLLSKDGTTASIESGTAEGYDFSAIDHDLCLVLDGRVMNPLYAFFIASDFANPASATATEVSDIINTQVGGLFAATSSNDTRVTLVSNIKRSSSSKIRIIENFDNAFRFNGAYSDITANVKSSSTNSQVFVSNGDTLYLGHLDVPFQTIYFNPAIPASAQMVYTAEFYDGVVWQTFDPYDGTLGFTQAGHLQFRIPHTWQKTLVNGVTAYWVRLTRNDAGLVTPPTESRIRICSANEILEFSETEILGSNKDYTLNRFVGQIELETPLQATDRLTMGSYDTRASVVSTGGTFNLSGGEALSVIVDGVSINVIFQVGDFAVGGAATVTEVITRINTSLPGATAVAVDSGTKVKLYVNKMDGTLQVAGGTANVALIFNTDLHTSLTSHVPSLESATAEPYVFNPGNTVIVVIDGNAANNFTLPCGKTGTLTGVTSPSLVADIGLISIFPNSTDLPTFDFLLTSRYERTIQDIQYISDNVNRAFVSIEYLTGGTAGLEIVTVTGAVIQIVIQSGVSTATQIKTAFDLVSAATALASATITGVGGNAQTAVAATLLASPRRAITAYAPLSGGLTLASSLPFTPLLTDTYEISPTNADQVVQIWNNKQITLISTKADVQTSSGGLKVQIASKVAGEGASVQVTGGTGNAALAFSVITVIGVDGYRHFTGLAQLTQWSVDGRDDDQENYPGIRAAGVQVEVAEPVKVPVTISLTITTREGVSLSSITNDLKSAVSSYVNNLNVGADVILSDIIVAVKGVSGVFDAKITLPIANIAIADSELARINESDIIIG